MSNVEGMYSVYFVKKTEQSESILRNSAVRYSTFCGSLFKPDPAIETVDLIQMDTSIYGVSYEVSETQVLKPESCNMHLFFLP